MTNAGGVAALGVVALILSGCGGSDAATGDETTGSGDAASTQTSTKEQVTYDFDNARVSDLDDQEPFVTDAKKVLIKLPDDLAGAMPLKSQHTIGQFMVSAKAFDTGVCRLDVDIEYAHNGIDKLAIPDKNGGIADPDNPKSYRVLARITGLGYIDHMKLVDAVPADDEVDTKKTYFTKDFSHTTIVDECSEGNDDTFATLGFPVYDPEANNEKIKDQAGADISVVKGSETSNDGATVIIHGDTAVEVNPKGIWQES